jgi:micrococcal nuclease
MLVLVLAALAAYDRLRPRESSPPPAVAGDDMTRYHGRTFRVTRVVDGDTLAVDAPDRGKPETVIRLWGVDTPEVHNAGPPQHYGPEASAFAKRIAGNKVVRLELVPDDTRGGYGRLLAYVYLPDGTMLNERLIAQGYGYAHTKYPHGLEDRFVRLERQARNKRLGLWRDVTFEDMPEWRQKELRRRQRSGARLEILPEGGTSVPDAALNLQWPMARVLGRASAAAAPPRPEAHPGVSPPPSRARRPLAA